MSKFYEGQKVTSAKTASYQIVDADAYKTFTNRGAGGAVTFTLPNTATIEVGWWCKFFSVVLAQNFIIASYGSSDNIVTKNDAGADTLTLSTAGERAGAGFELTWDGTGWLAEQMVGEAVTVTVA